MKVAIVLTVLLFACSASYLALAEPKNSPKPQEVFGSYWTAEPGWHTPSFNCVTTCSLAR